MTRSTPALLRGFLALAATTSLAGCMYLTPATGLCITQACRDFEKDRQLQAEAQRAAANQTPPPPNVHDLAADFKLTTTGIWSIAIVPTGEVDAQGNPLAVPRLDDSDPTGALTFRVAFGRAVPTEGGLVVSEGISVVTFNAGFTESDQQNRALLADATRQSMSVLFGTSPAPQIDEIEASLGGKPGRQVSMVGPGALPPLPSPAPGQPSAAPIQAPMIRAIGRCAMHRGRGYVVTVRTLEAAYARQKQDYDSLFDGFEFRDADPVYPPRPSAAPSAAPSAGPSAGASGAPSATPSAGPSAATSAAPSGTPSAAPSAAPAGTPLPSPAT